MYDPRRGSAGKLCSSNFNGKAPRRGGESKNWCVCRCVCSEGAGSGVPVHAQGPGCSHPHPRGARAAVGPELGGSWVGAEPGAGPLKDAWVLWNGCGCSSVFPSPPASLSPFLFASPLHGPGGPLLHSPGFWGGLSGGRVCFGVKPQRLPAPPPACGMRVCGAVLVFWVPGGSLGNCAPEWVRSCVSREAGAAHPGAGTPVCRYL